MRELFVIVVAIILTAAVAYWASQRHIECLKNGGVMKQDYLSIGCVGASLFTGGFLLSCSK